MRKESTGTKSAGTAATVSPSPSTPSPSLRELTPLKASLTTLKGVSVDIPDTYSKCKIDLQEDVYYNNQITATAFLFEGRSPPPSMRDMKNSFMLN